MYLLQKLVPTGNHHQTTTTKKYEVVVINQLKIVHTHFSHGHFNELRRSKNIFKLWCSREK